MAKRSIAVGRIRSFPTERPIRPCNGWTATSARCGYAVATKNRPPCAPRPTTGGVKRFLGVHPECVVLHLGCGLDTRAYRINPSSKVDWYDIDLPDVIGLRQRIFPPRAGLHTIAASVTDPRLLDTIPAALPVLAIGEGLTPYLRAADGVAMLGRITEHFPSGELLFDGYSPAGVWGLQRYPL
jgi:O-methyltransferase involved in polyketide biosynthesis